MIFYLLFVIFSLGTALLQSAYLRAPKGVVPTRRRVTYTIFAGIATSIQVLVGSFRIEPDLRSARSASFPSFTL